MPTLETDLQHHAEQVDAWRKEARETTNPTRRAYLQNRIDHAPNVEKHIRNYYAVQEAKRTMQAEREHAALAKVAAEQEAQIRGTLRSRWPGDDASFERAYPRLLEEYRVDRALGRAEPQPTYSPKVVL